MATQRNPLSQKHQKETLKKGKNKLPYTCKKYNNKNIRDKKYKRKIIKNTKKKKSEGGKNPAQYTF